jgi:hypothetical protein
MVINRDRAKGSITLSQAPYIRKVLETFMEVCVSNDSQNDSPLLSSKQHSLYRSVIGSLAYAANITRVDIAYAVAILSRHLHSPRSTHLTAALRICRYLLGTVELSMVFKPSPADTNPVTAFTDASYASDTSSSKSTSGIIINLFGNIIQWHVHKQPIVALSSTEAEYIALSDTAKEVLWFRQWLIDVLPNYILPPSIIYIDNKSAINLASHDGHHQRSKHIRVRYHHIRDCIANKIISAQWVSTIDQLADSLTKVTPSNIFNNFVSILLC